MSDLMTQPPESEADEQSESTFVWEPEPEGNRLSVFLLSLVAAFAVPILMYLGLKTTFDLLTDSAPPWVVALVSIVFGVAGVFLIFTVVDLLIKRLPERMGERIRPFAWVGPALVIVSVFLLYPAFEAIRLSFMDETSTNWVGWENYQYVFTEPSMLRSLVNTVLWIFVVPAVAVAIGLGFAVLADKLKRLESIAKSLIFLPMAISFIGAGITWRFVYSFRPEGLGEQIGLLNAMWTGIGQSPLDWLTISEFKFNTLLLMVVMVWLQTGFAMVILSSAIKGVPGDILEAARIDGATEIQVFWRVVVPNIMSSIVVVFTTMVINVLKIFDIVWVMTGGRDGTEVIAERMIRNMFTFRDFGRGSAVAVFMFIAVIPVMVINVRRFREEEALR